jgi:uncharacterized protein (DUF2267 family)
MSLDFEIYAARGKEFVSLVAEELAVPQVKAGRIVSAVFHALRNWLSHEESFQLLAQLPMSLKGVYVDGWLFSKDNNRISHLNDFLDEVKQEDRERSGYDFTDPSKAMAAVAVVFNALNYLVSEEEMNDVLNVIPPALKIFLKESMTGKGTVL